MDKFDCLKVFTRVAHLGSFTSAANELNTTQSAVSKKIAWLEGQIGVTLFHRHTRAISLTKSGRQYLGLALRLTDEIDSFETQLRHEQASVSGVLKLSVPSAFSTKMLAKPLNEFLMQHPDLSVDLSVSDRFTDLIEDDVDVVIRSAYLKDSGLRARWLFDNEPVIFASPDYLASSPDITAPGDLSWHQCLTYSLMTPSNLWYLIDGNDEFKIKVNEHIRCDNPEMLLKMVKLGQGIAAMPRWMIEEELKSGELIQLLEQVKMKKLPMYLIYKDSEYQPMRIRVFIEFMANAFSQ